MCIWCSHPISYSSHTCMTNMLLLITQVMCIWCRHPINYGSHTCMTNMLLLITQVMCIWCSHPISYLLTNMLLLITQVMCIWCSHPISCSASGLKALEDHVKSTKHVRNARLVMEAQAMIASGTAGNASRQLCGGLLAMQKKLHVCTCSVWCYICRCVWVSPPPPPPPIISFVYEQDPNT